MMSDFEGLEALKFCGLLSQHNYDLIGLSLQLSEHNKRVLEDANGGANKRRRNRVRNRGYAIDNDF
jgi:hypothetical protein